MKNSIESKKYSFEKTGLHDFHFVYVVGSGFEISYHDGSFNYTILREDVSKEWDHIRLILLDKNIQDDWVSFKEGVRNMRKNGWIKRKQKKGKRLIIRKRPGQNMRPIDELTQKINFIQIKMQSIRMKKPSILNRLKLSHLYFKSVGIQEKIENLTSGHAGFEFKDLK